MGASGYGCAEKPSGVEVLGFSTDAYSSVQFKEGGERYNLWCKEETCNVYITLNEDGDADVRRAGGAVESLKSQDGRLRVSVRDGDVVRVGGVRWEVMPKDFPRLTASGERTSMEWSLVGFFRTRDTVVPEEQRNVGEFVALLDERGSVVWWERAEAPMNVTWAGGTEVAWFEDTERAGVNYERDTVFEIHDIVTGKTRSLSVLPDGFKMDFHELERSGQSWWVIGARVEENVPGYGSRVISNAVFEVPDGGNPRELWRTTKGYKPEETDTRVLPGDEPITEPVHLNSIDVVDDRVVLSGRQTSEVLEIDVKSGEATWRMRGDSQVAMSKGSYRAYNLDRESAFCNQHDARVWEDGTISVFDNQSCTQNPARVLVYELGKDGAHLVWSRSSREVSSSVGSARRVKSGWLVSWGSARAPLAEELNEDGESVWSVLGDGSVMTYRALSVPRDAFRVLE